MADPYCGPCELFLAYRFMIDIFAGGVARYELAMASKSCVPALDLPWNWLKTIENQLLCMRNGLETELSRCAADYLRSRSDG